VVGPARFLLALLCLLTLTAASAECAWVLWQRVDSFDSRGALVSSPTDVGATYTSKFDPLAAPAPSRLDDAATGGRGEPTSVHRYLGWRPPHHAARR
jgi:hypothetical protein